MEEKEIKELKTVGTYNIHYEITASDFEHAFGRQPESKEEFDKFCEASDRGLEAQIDWAIIFQCAKEHMDWEAKN